MSECIAYSSPFSWCFECCRTKNRPHNTTAMHQSLMDYNKFLTHCVVVERSPLVPLRPKPKPQCGGKSASSHKHSCPDLCELQIDRCSLRCQTGMFHHSILAGQWHNEKTGCGRLKGLDICCSTKHNVHRLT